ncbi:alpha/beta fold hydrolase [Corynebacterium sp. ES2715-CONJ3]|uniref:alpha/beta fold hydrolase n=1 Tax=Corynebacterium sp. ES2715-CONJ3 TaxID=2974028 RepID=UPI0021690C0D|nr:alpha/beta hydrolase [Corynebacterium sp. ES2715-CONJ3]MCS4492093.1 alpha/beta hydrolase [Corynebacterium sp. ES2715-CONJ3]
MRAASPSTVALHGPFTHHDLYTRGTRLHAACAGEASSPLIILIHDSFSCWIDFAEVIPLLHEAGFHVAALDLRGYGMSDKPPHGHDLRILCGDLNGAIQTLGHNSAHLVGVGIGATLAWALATYEPKRVESISSCGFIHPTDMRRSVIRYPWLFLNLIAFKVFLALPSGVLKRLSFLLPRITAHDLKRTTVKEFHSSPGFMRNLTRRSTALAISNTLPAVVRSSRLSVVSTPLAWADRIITCPVLFLPGEKPSRQQRVLERAARERTLGAIRTVRIPHTKYRPHIENPDDFVNTVVRFIRGLS